MRVPVRALYVEQHALAWLREAGGKKAAVHHVVVLLSADSDTTEGRLDGERYYDVVRQVHAKGGLYVRPDVNLLRSGMSVIQQPFLKVTTNCGYLDG